MAHTMRGRDVTIQNTRYAEPPRIAISAAWDRKAEERSESIALLHFQQCSRVHVTQFYRTRHDTSTGVGPRSPAVSRSM